MPGRQHAVSNPIAARTSRSTSPVSRARSPLPPRSSRAPRPAAGQVVRRPEPAPDPGLPRASSMPSSSASSSRAAASPNASDRSASVAAASAYSTARTLPAIGAASRKCRASSLTARRPPLGRPPAPRRGAGAVSRAERAHPLVDRPAQQLVPDAVHQLRVPDLLQHSAREPLLEGGDQRLVVDPGGRAQHRERDAARADGHELQDLAHAGVAGARSSITPRTLSGIRAAAARPAIRDPACGATPPRAGRRCHPSARRVARRAGRLHRCSASPLRSAPGPPRPRAQPGGAARRRPAGAAPRGRPRARPAAARALAEQRHHDHPRRPRVAPDAAGGQRRRVGPLQVVQDEDERRAPGEAGHQRGKRRVEVVALGVGALRLVAIARRLGGAGAQAGSRRRSCARTPLCAASGSSAPVRQRRLERLHHGSYGVRTSGSQAPYSTRIPPRVPCSASSRASRVLPLPGSPPTRAIWRPSVHVRSSRASSCFISASRPTKGMRGRGWSCAGSEGGAASGGPRGLSSPRSGSSEGSWRRIASSRRRSSDDGSSPSSASSRRRLRG